VRTQNLLHILDGSATSEVVSDEIPSTIPDSARGADDASTVHSADTGQIDFSTASRRSGSAYHDQLLALVHAGMQVDTVWAGVMFSLVFQRKTRPGS
jgi:hypothetical protein